jgi:hypothetical protein
MAHNYVFCQPFIYGSSLKPSPVLAHEVNAREISRNARIGQALIENGGPRE